MPSWIPTKYHEPVVKPVRFFVRRRYFKLVQGRSAYEVQIGPLVVQWFYSPWAYSTVTRHFNVWLDPYWRKYRKG